MRTSDLLLRQVRQALAAAFLLGGCAALLQLALPLCAVHVFDSAIAAGSTNTLLLLAVIVLAALAALTCISVVRARILLRAGLWLDHTLGSHLLQDGLAHDASPEDLAEDAAALGRLRDACTRGTMLPILDAPWQLLLACVLFLLDWRLAAVGGLAMLALAVRGILAYRKLQARADHVDEAAQRSANWWQAATRMTGLSRLPATAADQWERLNREHVAGAYLLHTQSANVGHFAHFLRPVTQAAVLALGAWLVITGDLTVGVVVAASLVLWRMLDGSEKLLASLAEMAGVRAAWHRIADRPKPEIGRPAQAAADIPLLHFAGPFAAGLAAAALFLALGLGIAATTRVGQIAAFTGGTLFETRLAVVFPQRKGLSGNVLVTEGAIVSKGDIIATLDTRGLDARVASLKLQAQTAEIELAALNREIAALVAPGAPRLKSRAPLEKLEARVAVLDRQSRDLTAQIAAAENELQQSRILAPVSGRIASLAARPGMPVETDVPLATLMTADTTLLSRFLAPLGIGGLPQRLAQLMGLNVANATEPDKG